MEPLVTPQAPKTIAAISAAVDAEDPFDWRNPDHLDLLWEAFIERRLARMAGAHQAVDEAKLEAERIVRNATARLRREQWRWPGESEA